jgi:hypothetical protein
VKSLPYRENGVQTNDPIFGSRAIEILETIADGFCAIDRESQFVYHCRPVKQAVSADKGMILNAVLAI